jgi:hypothetical protein
VRVAAARNFRRLSPCLRLDVVVVVVDDIDVNGDVDMVATVATVDDRGTTSRSPSPTKSTFTFTTTTTIRDGN